MDGKGLKRYRERLNYSTRDLAKAIGVASATVSRWETGTRQIHPVFARMLDQFFQTAPAREPRRRKTTKKEAKP